MYCEYCKVVKIAKAFLKRKAPISELRKVVKEVCDESKENKRRVDSRSG